MEPMIEQQLRELMTNYGSIAEVWFDMSAPTPAQSKRFAAIVRELQPQAAINGRIWNNVGDFVTLGDNETPPPGLQPPFEVPASIYHETWGYRSWQKREGVDAKVRELVHGLAEARAHGGNYLLNIGPMGDGAVVPFEAQVLRGIGAWLREHPAALDVGRPAASEKIIPAAADGSIRIARSDWSKGTSFGFRNGYSTQYPTTVLLSAAVASPTTRSVMLHFEGASAPANARYRITLGDQVREQGEAQGLATDIGPFALPASENIPLTIRLARPAFPAEDIGLDFDAVRLLPVPGRKEAAP
jgi:alpha-L-fucosidase